MARHVKKGDLVIVIAGDGAWQKEYDAMGNLVSRRRDDTPRRVLRVLPDRNKVVVEGVNVRKHHVRPNRANQGGGVTEREKPIDLSNVQPVADGKPTRVRFEKRSDGSKVRLAARTGETLGEPLKKARL